LPTFGAGAMLASGTRPRVAARRRDRAHSGNPALLITTDLINLKAPDAAGAFFADVVKPDVRSEAKGDLSAPMSDFRFSLENGLKSDIAVGPVRANSSLRGPSGVNGYQGRRLSVRLERLIGQRQSQ
jgi:hypothetical protein